MKFDPPSRLGFGLFLALAMLTALAVAITEAVSGPTAVVVGGLAGGWAMFFSFRMPQRSLWAGAYLFLVAGTEFRVRDPLAGVEGSVDAQIALELAIYAFLGWVALRALLRLPRATLRLNVLETLLLGYVALAASSALWSPISSYTLIRGLQLVVLLAYALALIRTFGPDEGWWVVGSSIVAYTLSFSFLGFVAVATGLMPPYGERFSWFYSHPIEIGSYTALSAVVVLARLLFGNRPAKYRRSLWIVVGVSTVMLIATFSRGALIAFLVVVGALVTIRVANRAVATLAVLAGTLGALVLINLPGGLFTLFDFIAWLPGGESILRGQSAEDLFSLTGRTELWRSLIPAFGQRPLIGHGYQVTRLVALQIAPWAGEAHNGMLQSLVDLGLLGTALLLGALLGALAVNYLRTVALDPRENECALRASQFAALLYLFVNSIGTAGFAGVPGFEPLILYAAAASLFPTGDRHPAPRRRSVHRTAPSGVSG